MMSVNNITAPLSLEEQTELLRRENASLRWTNLNLEHHIRVMSKGSWDAELTLNMHGYLVRKIERQRLAILRLQWHGWEPDVIIQEE